MKIGSEGLEILKQWEGLKLSAYLDSAGVPTIGYGHTRGVRMGMTCTREQALAWLLEDLAEAERWVAHYAARRARPLTQRQADALIVFEFNTGAFARYGTKAQVVRAVIEGRDDIVDDRMADWNKVTDPVSGQLVKSAGLVNRRAAEAVLWNAGTADAAAAARPAPVAPIDPPKPEEPHDDPSRGANTVPEPPKPAPVATSPTVVAPAVVAAGGVVQAWADAVEWANGHREEILLAFVLLAAATVAWSAWRAWRDR